MSGYVYTSVEMEITEEDRRGIAEALGFDYDKYLVDKARFEATASPEVKQAVKDTHKAMHRALFGLDAPSLEADKESR